MAPSASRILVLYWGRLSGGAHYALEMTRGLADARPGSVWGSFSRQNELVADVRALPLDVLWIDTYQSKAQFITSTIGLPVKLARLAAFLRRNRIDVVYCPMSQYWWPAVAMLCRSLGIRTVFTCHDAVPHLGDGGALRARIMRWEVRSADAVIALSSHVRAEIAAVRGDDRSVHLVPLGALEHGPSISATPATDGSPRRLLFFGRILAYKGLGLLLEAVSSLQKEFPDLALEIAGDGDLSPYRDALADVKNLTLHNRWIADHEVADIFARNDILVTPYLEATQSGPVTTAFAMGLPVVATPVGGLAEQVQDGRTGTLARNVSAGALADAIRDLLTSDARFSTYRTNALEYARRDLAWPALAERVATTCDGVARDRMN